MRKRRSMRAWWRWGLTVLAVLSVITLFTSVRHRAFVARCVYCTAPDGSPDDGAMELLDVCEGQLSICICRPPLINPHGSHLESGFEGGYAPVWNWAFKREVDRDDTRVIYYIPLWSVAVLTGGPAALLWFGHVRGRYGPGCCKKCGYDRRGLAADAKCPECGTTPSA